MRFLGIDYGTKNVGLALSDEAGRFAYPYKVIPNTGRLAMVIANICEREGVEKIILGESRDYRGEPNPIAVASEQLKDKLTAITGLPVIFESEVLSTSEAGRIIGHDTTTDARAAAIILNSYLERGS